MSEIRSKETALTVALFEYIKELCGRGKTENAEDKAVNGDTTDPDEFKAETDPKKILAALKKEAKLIAGKLVKEKGKAALAGALKDVGVKKFTELAAEPAVFQGFIASVEKALAAKPEPEDDDLGLGEDAPADPPVERTMADIRALLLKINNTKGLGRDVSAQILVKAGVKRLPELKKDAFGVVYNLAEATLAKAV